MSCGRGFGGCGRGRSGGREGGIRPRWWVGQRPALAAEDFLTLVDEGRWAEGYAATGAEFRRLNTLAVWSEVSERVRPPLGAVLTRDLVGNEWVPAPPAGYRLIKFRSAYANGTRQTESLSPAWEDGAWTVAGITFE